MRFAFILMILSMVSCGAVFGALNGAHVSVDFQWWQWDAPIGAALLVALFFGWLLGGLVTWFGQVPQLRRDLRGARARIRALEASPSASRQGSPG